MCGFQARDKQHTFPIATQRISTIFRCICECPKPCLERFACTICELSLQVFFLSNSNRTPQCLHDIEKGAARWEGGGLQRSSQTVQNQNSELWLHCLCENRLSRPRRSEFLREDIWHAVAADSYMARSTASGALTRAGAGGPICFQERSYGLGLATPCARPRSHLLSWLAILSNASMCCRQYVNNVNRI